jgi:glyoxylate/hydroxypyruvate reductase A
MADDPNSPGPALELLLCGTWSTTERDTWAAALRAAMPRHRLHLERPTGTPIDVAIVANPPAGALNGLPRLRLIQSLWAGVDRLLADPTLPPQVPVARMVDPAMNAAMAETALWAALSLQRGTFRYAHQQRAACWRLLPQRRADEWTVLVLGLGQMGRTAARALVRQGYRVRGWSRQPALAEVGVTLFHGDAALPQALAGAEVVINLLPLTPRRAACSTRAGWAALPRGAAW